MRLNYKNCSLRRILFQTLKQYSDCKSFIAHTFDKNTLKIKNVSDIQMINNKKHCFQLCLERVLGFECPYFCVPDRARNLTCAPERQGAQKEFCLFIALVDKYFLIIVCSTVFMILGIVLRTLSYLGDNQQKDFLFDFFSGFQIIN